MWVGKLESNQSNINDEVVHFLSTLKDSQETLKRLYDITEEETSELSYGYEDYDKIYLNRNYKKLLNEGNTWNRRIGHDELTVLYYFFRFLAGWIDYFKGIPVTYDLRGNKEPPKTDLRPLCNYINLISIGIILSVIYILLKVIIRLI